VKILQHPTLVMHLGSFRGADGSDYRHALYRPT
jgi:hypothetical protein